MVIRELLNGSFSKLSCLIELDCFVLFTCIVFILPQFSNCFSILVVFIALLQLCKGKVDMVFKFSIFIVFCLNYLTMFDEFTI